MEDLLLQADELTPTQIRDLINALKSLLEDKEADEVEVKIGDMVEFEIKKGVLASGVVTHVTPKRVTVNVHEAGGETSAPTRGITITYSAPEQDPLAEDDSHE
jgi:transcription antitermination factor NusG